MSSKLYHISDRNLSGLTFYPRIPRRTILGEDRKTGRICVSNNIKGCIKGEASGLTYYYVHEPVTYNIKIKKPSKKEVPDVKKTREHWILEPVKMKCIGLIDTTGTNSRRVKWKWIQKYDSQRISL